MAIVSKKTRMIYFDVTKVASTSLKHIFYEIETGHPFGSKPPPSIVTRFSRVLIGQPFAEPKRIHGVKWLQTRKFSGRLLTSPAYLEYHRLAVIRDPILRLFSAWLDKIHSHQLASRAHEYRAMKAIGLPAEPTFGDLIENIDEYRRLSTPVRAHSTPYSWHLGEDIDVFDSIYCIEDLRGLERLLSLRAGRDLKLPMRNKARIDTRAIDLSPERIDKLIAMTRCDYVLVSKFYQPDDAIDKIMRYKHYAN